MVLLIYILMEVLWGNQLIYIYFIQFWSYTSVYIAVVLALEMILEVSYFSSHTSQWGYHWRDELLMWLSVCQMDLWHDLNHNMYGESCNIPGFCWFLHPLFWRNIDVCFYLFWFFYLLEYMMVLCGHCMRYSMPCLKERKAASIGAFKF